MGILSNHDGSVTVRHAGVGRTLQPADFVSVETTAEIETRLGGLTKAALGREVALHIFSRSPLLFVIRSAPLATRIPANWWVPPIIRFP